MKKITIKKDSKVLFLGDSISDPKFNFQFAYKIKGRNIYALQLKKKFKIPCSNYPDVKIGEQLMLNLYARATNQDVWELKEKRTN